MDMRPHRLRRICNGQQRPTEQERETIVRALDGTDPFDPGSRFKDQDRAAHARLIEWAKGMGGLAHVRQQRASTVRARRTDMDGTALGGSCRPEMLPPFRSRGGPVVQYVVYG